MSVLVYQRPNEQEEEGGIQYGCHLAKDKRDARTIAQVLPLYLNLNNIVVPTHYNC